MEQRVLVAYASRYGGTAEIALKIGEVLRAAGLSSDVLPVGQITDLSSYQAVVLGSGLYVGKWLKEAARFLQRQEKALSERPVWIFSSGPTGEGDPVELVEGWGFPKALQPVADRIKPRDMTVFHGVLVMSKLSALHRWMIGMVKSPVGDFRDWQAIEAWAEGIAETLKEASAQ